jgi:23S rRNA (adenine2503-C2)-methyltransferase
MLILPPQKKNEQSAQKNQKIDRSWVCGQSLNLGGMMISLHAVSLGELKSWLEGRGEKGFRAKQIFQWVYEKKVVDWQQMTDLNKGLREHLSSTFALSTLKCVRELHSKDGETIKFLWELADGQLVESVLICSEDRRTVCVSSQVGCPARCAFCASGKEGLKRNLSAGEIFEQVFAIDQFLHGKGERVSHVVFMGMGEPLENYDSVVQAIGCLCDPERLGLSQRRITVSTVGVVEGIKKLSEEGIKVNLVLSLHAPNQHVRKKIIPYARKYPIEEVLSAMLCYAQKTKRDITYEYTLLAGINDQREHAEELAALLQGQQCTVNLIPYNPVEGLHLQRPEKERIEEFRSILVEEGIVTTWRYTKGKDIAAACGQLALQEKRETFTMAQN